MSSINVDVPVTTFSDENIAEVLLDRLWTTDHVNGLADALVEEAQNNEREETLGMLCRRILHVLGG